MRFGLFGAQSWSRSISCFSARNYTKCTKISKKNQVLWSTAKVNPNLTYLRRILFENDGKWWSNHIFIIIITNFRIFFRVGKCLWWSAENGINLSVLILCFLGAVDLLNFFLKILGKKFARSFDLPPRSKLIFYVWVNSPEKMMKNGGRIIFL